LQRWPAAPLRVLETGAGTGELAAAALERLPAASHPSLRWSILEISPTLADAQRLRLSAWSDQVDVTVQDVEAADLGDQDVDVLVSNEMAGDLRSDWLNRDDLESASPIARDLIERFGIDLSDAPESFWLNSGAIALIERAAKALAPGGMLWLSEFGHRDAWPVESTQLDHAEVSLHFGVLARIAAQLGLDVEIVDVADVIELDEHVEALATTATFFRNLRALAADRGIHIDKRAWTRDALADAFGDRLPMQRVGNLRFQPIGERVMGLRPREFLALLATKPAGREPA
jgi:SAM-dependent methyltransferase